MDEIIKHLFRGILDQFKSYKRHATQASTDTRLFVADDDSYVVLCDGGQLKLKIADYKMMKRSSQIYFGSELSDGSIAVGQRGQFSIQVVKEGYVCINSYSYPLRTNADSHLSEGFLNEVSESLDSLASKFYRDIRDNLFLADSDAIQKAKQHVATYRERLS